MFQNCAVLGFEKLSEISRAMTVSDRYRNVYIRTKNFLTSYRALSDGRTALEILRQHLEREKFLFSEWKIHWIATCTLLRSSIDLFRQDINSCISKDIREALRKEWEEIGADRERHAIFWDFLRKERDSVIHHYKWSAYQVWLDKEGNQVSPTLSLLRVEPNAKSTVIEMQHGRYEGKNSIELFESAANWVEERIFSAISNAGFDPEEERNLITFKPREKIGKAELRGITLRLSSNDEDA